MKTERLDIRVPYPEICGNLITYPCFVEAKYDGEMGIYVLELGKIFGKNGLARSECTLTDDLKIVAEELNTTCIYGELMYREGYAGDIYKLLSASKTDDANLRFVPFDFAALGIALIDRKQMLNEAIDKLMLINNNISRLRKIHCEWVTNKLELEETFGMFTAVGYEGVVCKGPSGKGFTTKTSWVKLKKKYTADLRVISADPTQQRIGLTHNDQSELCGCKVPNISYSERMALVGKIVEIQYLQKLTDATGVLTGLRNPVFLRVREDKTTVSLK